MLSTKWICEKKTIRNLPSPDCFHSIDLLPIRLCAWWRHEWRKRFVAYVLVYRKKKSDFSRFHKHFFLFIYFLSQIIPFEVPVSTPSTPKQTNKKMERVFRQLIEICQLTVISINSYTNNCKCPKYQKTTAEWSSCSSDRARKLPLLCDEAQASGRDHAIRRSGRKLWRDTLQKVSGCNILEWHGRRLRCCVDSLVLMLRLPQVATDHRFQHESGLPLPSTSWQPAPSIEW